MECLSRTNKCATEYYRQIDDSLLFLIFTWEMKPIIPSDSEININAFWEALVYTRWWRTNLRQQLLVKCECHGTIRFTNIYSTKHIHYNCNWQTCDSASTHLCVYEQWIWLSFWHIEKFCKRYETNGIGIGSGNGNETNNRNIQSKN